MFLTTYEISQREVRRYTSATIDVINSFCSSSFVSWIKQNSTESLEIFCVHRIQSGVIMFKWRYSKGWYRQMTVSNRIVCHVNSIRCLLFTTSSSKCTNFCWIHSPHEVLKKGRYIRAKHQLKRLIPGKTVTIPLAVHIKNCHSSLC